MNKLYTTYSGIDTQLYLNGRALDDVLSVRYSEELTPTDNQELFDHPGYKIVCNINCLINDNTNVKDLIKSEENIITLKLQSENGENKVVEFEEPIFLNRYVDIETDLVVLTETYTFIAKSADFINTKGEGIK